MQYVPQIKMYKNSKESFEKTLKGLQEVLPHLKVDDRKDHAAKSIQIFERSLSQYGVYCFLAFGENAPFPFAVEKTVYSRPKIEKEFSSLEDAVSYIQEHHYYEDPAAKDRYNAEDDDE